MNLADPSLLKFGSYINGNWCNNQQHFKVINPANCEQLASIAEVTDEQLGDAVEQAKVAQKQWAKLTAKQRSKVLMNWHQLIMDNLDDLAIIMTLEQGKPIFESKGEITNAATYIEWFAEQAKRTYGDVIASQSDDRRQMTILQPIGIVSAITPWNYPMGMIARKAAPALAAGCSIIIKPSDLTPLSALALCELSKRAGIPEGVFNVVVGTNAQAIGEVLTQHPSIRKFSFTGSTKVGKKLLAQCASTVKKTSLELGGNAPLIVFDDADLDKAVSETMVSKFRNAGQTCVCANRILVQSGIYPEFINRLSKQIAKLRLTQGINERTEAVDSRAIGPLIDHTAIKKMHALVKSAKDQGADILMGGATAQAKGVNYYQPTLISNVSNDMHIAQQEIFGPIASVLPFETEQQAIEMANATDYGLAAYFFTEDHARSWRMSEALEFGMIGSNVGILTSVQAPFGGVKQSGLGREGSQYGLDDYMEMKYICMGV